MTIKQRVLALEAAVCALEHPDNPVPAEILKPLVAWLDEWCGEQFSGAQEIDFDRFLKEQVEAVETLALSPEVFGGVP